MIITHVEMSEWGKHDFAENLLCSMSVKCDYCRKNSTLK